MSFLGDLRHAPAAIKMPAGTSSSISMGGDGVGVGVGVGVASSSDPLQNLSSVQARIAVLQKILRHSIDSNTLMGGDRMEMVSAEISSAIHQIIVNGAALLASTHQTQNTLETFNQKSQRTHESTPNKATHDKLDESKAEAIKESEDLEEITELDAVELLAEHVHFCDICGKGFKRDANLRMHMRAHGDRFKTPEALAKPDAEKCVDFRRRKTRFSCPFVGCNRNKQHKKFRPLKSVICVKNHFKRSHCPKMYSCTRCNKKSFSVLADLKSHLKHCGETKWKCSCGTSFSRKDKLFGHMALFEGHMPAVMVAETEAEEEQVEDQKRKGEVEDFESKGKVEDFVFKDKMEMDGHGGPPTSNNVSFEEFLDGFGSIDSFCFQDVLGESNATMDALFNF